MRLSAEEYLVLIYRIVWVATRQATHVRCDGFVPKFPVNSVQLTMINGQDTHGKT